MSRSHLDAAGLYVSGVAYRPPAAGNSMCVPRSSSRTGLSSGSGTVESRWAIASAVSPLVSRSTVEHPALGLVFAYRAYSRNAPSGNNLRFRHNESSGRTFREA